MNFKPDIIKRSVAIGGRLACIHASFSGDAVASVREEVLPIWPTVQWQNVSIDNVEHVLTATGVDHDDQKYRLTVGSMGCGYEGTGVRAAAEVLSLLGFGEEKELLAIIVQPTTTPNWKSRHEFAKGELME